MENNVSLPVLFCLVRGKNEATYCKLLGLVEELAKNVGLTVFNREVTLTCDFELALINAVQHVYGLVNIKCCFFHYTQNIRRNAVKQINTFKRAAGECSEKHRSALKMERRLMMLPLVPLDLITPELVQFIVKASTDGRTEPPRELKAIRDYVLTFYVGKRRVGSGALDGPRYPPCLWNVSGMANRTNNAAESVHTLMNPEVSGRLSVFNFLRIVEKQMKRTNDRIRNACKSES